MMPDRAHELRARLTNVADLCVKLGLKVARGANARQAMAVCLWHADRTPSLSIRIAKDGTVAAKCHACGATADALGLIEKARDATDFRDVLTIAADLANAPSLAPTGHENDRQKTHEPTCSDLEYELVWNAVAEVSFPLSKAAPSVAQYLLGRGIFADAEAAGCFGLPRDGKALVASLLSTFERATLEAAGILRCGHDSLDWPEWSLCIPWRNRHGHVQCVQRRRLDSGEPKYRFPFGRAPRQPYGVEYLRDALDYAGPGAEVVITEGALDCLARRRIARQRDERCAVIGVVSASSPDIGLPVDVIKGRVVVLALDNDKHGEAACAKVYAALRGVATRFVRETPRGAKDWNAALSGGSDAETG